MSLDDVLIVVSIFSMNKKTNDGNMFSNVTDSDKRRLKERIFTSIEQIKRKKRLRFYYGAAASVMLLVAFGAYNNLIKEESAITDFVNTSDFVNNNVDQVTILLDDDEGVNLEGDNTSIVYSKDGEELVVDNSKTLKQNENSKPKIKFNTLIVPYGKRSNLKLSDGTMVWLNAGSKLVYPTAFNSKTREVYLVGEASFDVAHDAEHPFKVLTGNQEIEVLGTVFNVSSYPDDIDNFVVLKSGSVKVAHNIQAKKNLFSRGNKIESVITPGTKANLNLITNKVTTKQVNVDDYFAWMDGVLILKNNDLNFIVKKLSRYYNIKIAIENKELSNETFSGYLDLKDNVENVLEVLKQSTALKEYKTTKINTISIN